MKTINTTPLSFYKELRAQKYGLRHTLQLVRVLKHYGHCYTINGLYVLNKKRA